MTKFEDKTRWIIKRLMDDFEFTPEECYAIVGNLAHETGGFRYMQEIKPTVKGSKGGYGWAQWTGPRRRQFEKFCADSKLSVDSDEGNYQFLRWELQNTEKAAVVAVKNVKDGELLKKVVAFENAYERAGVKHYDSRMVWAQRAQDVWEGATAIVPDVETVDKETGMSGFFVSMFLVRAKAVVAFFLTGLVTLIVQSLETGTGFDVPNTWEEWLRTLITSLVVAVGVERMPNKTEPEVKPKTRNK